MANAHTHSAHPVAPGKYTASKRTKTIYSVLIFVGLLLVALGLFQDQKRTWFSFLTSYFYFTSLALGGLFFAAIQHVAKAGWSVNVRRFAEAMTSFLPVAAVGAVALIFGLGHLYEWTHLDVVAKDPILAGKSSYLNSTFFVIRMAIFIGGWLIFSKLIVGHSVKQDQDGNENHTLKNVGLSIGFILFFALSYSLFSVDTLMSLQPHWFSTIWGVYCFAGLFQSTLAVLVITCVVMMKKGLVRGLVTEDHLHDLGKFLKGFTVFMAYIAFSQFLLIWYANLPEETIFYLARSTGGWMAVTLSLLVFKFIVPFVLLLPKAAKRSPGHLVLVSTIILIMQYVDIMWMVYPNYDHHVVFSWYEVGAFLLFGGLFLWTLTSFLTRNNIIPVKDPRIDESTHHHVTY